LAVGIPPARDDAVKEFDQSFAVDGIRLVYVKRLVEERTPPEDRKFSPSRSLRHAP
jgi:hypothetical protein